MRGFLRAGALQTGGIAVVTKSCLEFFVPCGELAACFSDIRLVAIRAIQFLYTRQGLLVMGMVFVSK